MEAARLEGQAEETRGCQYLPPPTSVHTHRAGVSFQGKQVLTSKYGRVVQGFCPGGKAGHMDKELYSSEKTDFIWN